METTEKPTTDKPANGAVPQQQAIVKAPANPVGSGTIDVFASSSNFESAQRMAKALATSSLVPEAYRGNVSNVLIAMEIAARIGASVFAVMQNMDVIHGRPGFRATFLIATVNASGRFTPLRFRFEGKPGALEWGCRAWAKDRDGGEECIGTLITLDMAAKEGWSSKNGSKWKTMPEQMLMYRAAAFWTRVYAPELSLGMHTADEMEDIDVNPEIAQATSAESLRALESRLRGDTLIDAETVQHGNKCPARTGGRMCNCGALEMAPAPTVERDPEQVAYEEHKRKEDAGKGKGIRVKKADGEVVNASDFGDPPPDQD